VSPDDRAADAATVSRTVEVVGTRSARD